MERQGAGSFLYNFLIDDLEEFMRVASPAHITDWNTFFEEIKDHQTDPNLKTILKNLDKPTFDALLQKVMLIKIEQPFDEVCKVLIDALDISDLEKDATAAQLQQEFAPLLAQLKQEKLSKKAQFSLHQTTRSLLNLIPQTLDTFLKAFNLIEVGKKPETSWDFYAIIEIYCKIFLIPHVLATVVGAVVVGSLQIYLIVALLILIGLAGVYCYLRWLRPCPQKLNIGTNLSELARAGQLKPVVARDHEVQRIISRLGTTNNENPTNLILIGKPGVGKSEIVRRVAELMPEKTIFSLNPVELSTGYTTAAEKLNSIMGEIKGHEHKVIFYIDELPAGFKNERSNLADLLKPFLERGGLQFITATTLTEYNKYIASDPALAQRLSVERIQRPSRSQTLTILNDRINRCATGIFLEKELAKNICGKTHGKSLRDRVQILNEGINQIHAFDIETYLPQELKSLKEKKAHLTRQSIEHLERKSLSRLARTKIEIQRQEKVLNEQKAKARKIRSLIQEQQRTKQDIYQQIETLTDPKKLLLLQNYYLPELEKVISSSIDALQNENPDFKMRLDMTLIDQIIAARSVV